MSFQHFGHNHRPARQKHETKMEVDGHKLGKLVRRCLGALGRKRD